MSPVEDPVMVHDSWLFRMFADNETAFLYRLYAVALKCDQDTEDDLLAVVSASVQHGVLREWIWESFKDQAFIRRDTIRLLFAHFSVTVTRSVENLLSDICQLKSLLLVDKNGQPLTKPAFGHKRRAVESSLKISLEDLTGFDAVEKTRLMANCFKHRDGKTDQEFVDKLGGSPGEVIKFEQEDWPRVFYGLKAFLSGLAEKL
jgi:hypothetical protein